MSKTVNIDLIKQITRQYGDSFYILDSDVFENNIIELINAFRKFYAKTNIAYSYKTNYIPKLVKIVDKLGGYAEVVSEMELEIAQKSGVKNDHVIWNGPIKNYEIVEKFLLNGGIVNLDSIHEIDNILYIAKEHPENVLQVGIRVNYNVGDGVLSRFGFDVDGEDFDVVLTAIKNTPNVRLVNLQAHFAKRDPYFWNSRAEGMLRTYERVVNDYGLKPKRLDIGGGIYGKMPDDFREQLGIEKCDFNDYACKAARLFSERFKDCKEDAPWLFIEPGTAVAANCMRFVSKIKTIKKIQGKFIATTNGSQKNISMNGLNPPLQVISNGKVHENYRNLDIAGYTCIESDYLYRGYEGPLGVGDYIICENCGSYSIGMKPPFILPNVSVVDISGEEIELIKRAENFEDLFHTYSFM